MANFAVVKFSGKQFLVKKGDKIQVANLDYGVGKEVKFDQVLIVANDTVKIGKPQVINFKVIGKVLRKFAGEKITVTKFKSKSRYLKRIGFRPKLAEIEITRIGA